MITRPTASPSHASANAPVLSLACGNYTLQGWSRAGVQTYWRVPEWKLALDHGAHPWEFASAHVLALTHFHADHAGGLIAYLSTRNLHGHPPPIVAFPKVYEQRLKDFLAAWEALSGDSLGYELRPLVAGDELPLGGKRVLRAFHSVHVIPSLGYVVVESRGKLKPALAGLSGEEISARRRVGESVEDVYEISRLAFCGDTAPSTLDRNPFLYEVETLLLECTFLAASPGPADAERFGHMHVQELIERATLFRNERLVLTHFSLRHSEREIVEVLAAKLPEGLRERVVAWI